MWWHPLISLALGGILGWRIGVWRRRRKREIAEWKYRQSVRG